MKYLYILESVDGEHFYIGITDDVSARLIKHNAGEVPHTSKFRPWRVRTYIAFTDEKLAPSKNTSNLDLAGHLRKNACDA